MAYLTLMRRKLESSGQGDECVCRGLQVELPSQCCAWCQIRLSQWLDQVFGRRKRRR
jgi:hypothetical protein